MSDETELPEDVTVCNRVANAAVALPGHSTTDCEQCGETVIVNPATIESIAEGVYPDYIICKTCAVEATDG